MTGRILNKRPKSVLHGKDSEAIDTLIAVHCEVLDPKVLDCTYNKGKMWRGSAYRPISMDITPEFSVDVLADFTSMPFALHALDVIVFDPPHLPVASKNSSCIWEEQYGLTADDPKLLRSGDNVSLMFLPFLKEAQRVLKVGGIVLAKIADIVHNHRYQWQHVDLINAAMSLGMTPCDLMVKTSVSSGNLSSSKWKNVYHLRRSHSYWIVIRNAPYDERKNKDKLQLLVKREMV